jgi:hypothetical protein
MTTIKKYEMPSELVNLVGKTDRFFLEKFQ